ncbi:hypothetical protein ABBQ32_000691 [Trebouxia sp. C0010 RCD-2024]
MSEGLLPPSQESATNAPPGSVAASRPNTDPDAIKLSRNLKKLGITQVTAKKAAPSPRPRAPHTTSRLVPSSLQLATIPGSRVEI